MLLWSTVCYLTSEKISSFSKSCFCNKPVCGETWQLQGSPVDPLLESGESIEFHHSSSTRSTSASHGRTTVISSDPALLESCDTCRSECDGLWRARLRKCSASRLFGTINTPLPLCERQHSLLLQRRHVRHAHASHARRAVLSVNTRNLRFYCASKHLAVQQSFILKTNRLLR